MKESNLKLNKKQEEKLVEYALERVRQLKEDNRERIESDKISWKTYHNDRTDRIDYDGIFHHSNLSVPMTSLVPSLLEWRERLLGQSVLSRMCCL